MLRPFDFQGSDAEYIQYLECQELEAQRLSGPSAQRKLDQGPSPQSTNAAPIHFIIWQPPGETSHQHRKRSQPPRWRKELDSFILSLPHRDSWEAASTRGRPPHRQAEPAGGPSLAWGTTHARAGGFMLANGRRSLAQRMTGSSSSRDVGNGQWMLACAEKSNFTRRAENFQS
ncbi:hypothetical protein BJX63DRAFT_438321 [Aspergillus granulosus]|uniref:Uncharacterized protein n=1 Tax=Aspergillus granulosus TaxID=176169 RepID=A0ABR4GSC3_9EURO